ncbi:hypothetical protein [Olivibacter sitiensis]|uniref:hypothetical protein n=1 Tax=Olivibacter sitiensis TaxID=376470 RepID=UPI0003F5CC77|nr:hypothetical protein [Olivibacter sitiensis]
MKDFEALKILWHEQRIHPALSAEEIVSTIKAKQSDMRRRLTFQVFTIAGVLVAAIAIWLLIPFQTWTSHFALLIIAICLTYYFIVQMDSNRSFQKHENLIAEPKAYIQFLKSYKSMRNRLNTRNYYIYESCICLAFALYFVELYFVLPLWLFLMLALATAMWVIYCHRVLIKDYVTKENAQLQELIDHLEKLDRQFEENAP